MEKVTFADPETGEGIEVFVLEETEVGGARYLLVAEDESGDCDAYILREAAACGDDVIYEMVNDDGELAALGKIFAELVDDADIEF